MSYTQAAEFELASENYVEGQDTTDSSTTYDKGELINFNDYVGFALSDVAVSSKGAFVLKADRVNALKKTEAITMGQTLYFDNSVNKVTAIDSSAGLPSIGYALEDAASSANTILMYFDGTGESSLT